MSGGHVNYVVEALALRMDSLDSEAEYQLGEAKVHQTYANKALAEVERIGKVKQELSDAIEREKKVTQ